MERTSLPPLHARARDARRRRPVVGDPHAAGLADDLELGDGPGRADALCTLLRGAILDEWVRAFVAEHPTCTVVELGPGLDRRADRLGGEGPAHWVDVELPEVAELRRELLPGPGGPEPDPAAGPVSSPAAGPVSSPVAGPVSSPVAGPVSSLVAGSALDEDWLDTARALPGPYLVVADSVLTLLPEQGVQRLVFTAARMLPGAVLATDVLSRAAAARISGGALCGVEVDWTCEDPRELEPWGLRLLEACGAGEPPAAVAARIPYTTRAFATALRAVPALRGHRLARYEILPG
ncbi:class I SAM-dependent methyltransferase [Pseudonocardia phyllosphaerae]|uniref:class I SAM-dependent methyltransferase n=1 Tax=Pseudonocardia phyllosphaerae TaxID=3390502 RepID=UPI0039783584